MSTMFWVNTADLDEYQRQAVEKIHDTTSFLLKGPAGSGKSNILLLRAKVLTLKKKTNFKTVVFTSSLKKFVEEGCEYYGIDPATVVTQMSFFKTILDEYGITYELSGVFEPDRIMLAGKVKFLVDAGSVSDSYIETLLIDEAQDYTDTELLVFRGLCKTLILATDSRQSIYKTTHTTGLPEILVSNKIVELKWHYRSGLALCKVADAILSDTATYPRVQTDCKYPETSKKSSVISIHMADISGQFQAIIKNLESQLFLYPKERIGVIFPKREQASEFRDYFSSCGITDQTGMIRIDTLHGAKGWEFRAVHLGGCEALPKMGAVQKRLVYTGILRGKTSAHLYYSGHLPGYLTAALAVLEPPAPTPAFDDLFKG